MHTAVEKVIRAAEAHIDAEEYRSHSDATIERMDPIRSAIAMLRAVDPKIDRNCIGENTWEIRIGGGWAPIDYVTLQDASAPDPDPVAGVAALDAELAELQRADREAR